MSDDDEDSGKPKRVFHTFKLRVLPTEDWMNYGACQDLPIETFFPPEITNQHHNPGIAICQSCLHQESCLDYAIRHHIEDGIWGGTTGNERKRMRRAAAKARRLALDPLAPASSGHALLHGTSHG